MAKVTKADHKIFWIGFGTICSAILVVVFSVRHDQAIKSPERDSFEKPSIRYDVVRDIDQEPIRRMLTVMIPEPISEYDLAVLSNQIRFSLPENRYKFISIRFHTPKMPVDGDVWARAAFYHDKPAEITIHGEKLGETKQKAYPIK